MDIRGTDPWKIGFALDDDTTAKTILGSTSILEDTWNHFVIVIDRTGANKILGYLNGVEDASVSAISSLNTISNSAPLSIGGILKENDAQQNFFVGSISEVAFYDTVLSAAHVKTIYNGRQPYNHKKGIKTSNLKAWWRMGDGTLDGSSQITGNTDDSPQDNIISDEVTSNLGAELYTSANSMSTNEADDQSTGLTVISGCTVANETSVTNGSSNSLKYTATGNADGIMIDLTSDIDLTPGSLYKVSVDARHIGSGGIQSIRLTEQHGLGTTGETLEIIDISNSMTTFVTYTAYFIHNDTTTRYFGARETSGTDDGGLYLDNLSVREVNGNAGIMRNMDFEDFVGDTP